MVSQFGPGLQVYLGILKRLLRISSGRTIGRIDLMATSSFDLETLTPKHQGGTPAANALLRRVDLTTLRLFIAICEEKNLTRAASREGIAASAVSKRMHDFEAAFGVTLFARLSKGMALTPAGEALLHHARVTLLNVEKIAVELAEYSNGVRGHVRMLANLSAIVQFLPEDLSQFFSAHGLLRVASALRRQGQARVAVERRQFHRHLVTAALGLAAVDIDRIDQLRLFAGDGQGSGRQDQAQRQGGNG